MSVLKSFALEHCLLRGKDYEHTCGDENLRDDDECLACGERDCPFKEPLHYHHDGCPQCDANEELK